MTAVRPAPTRDCHVTLDGGVEGGVVLAPGCDRYVVYQPGFLFKGQSLVNRGERDGLVIWAAFVGNKPQYPPRVNAHMVKFGEPLYEIPLIDMAWPLDTCEPSLFLTFRVKNTAVEPGRCWFEVHGLTLS